MKRNFHQSIGSLPTNASDYQSQETSDGLLALPGSLSFENDIDETTSLQTLSQPFRNMKRSMNFTDSGNVTFGSATNNTFSLKRDAIRKAWSMWHKIESTKSHCLVNTMVQLVNSEEQTSTFYLPGMLFFVFKNKETRRYKNAALIPLYLINKAFHSWNVYQESKGASSCATCNCTLCTAAKKKELETLGAMFQPVGVVMEDFDTDTLSEAGSFRRSQRAYPHVFATDGEVPILNYWYTLDRAMDMTRSIVQCKGSGRAVDLHQASKLSVGESLFVGFSIDKEKLFLTPVTGTTLECLFTLDETNKKSCFWSLGKVVSCVGVATAKFALTGIPFARGMKSETDYAPRHFEMPKNSKLRESLFLTISLAKGLLLPYDETQS
jgi:hypothetical protein